MTAQELQAQQTITETLQLATEQQRAGNIEAAEAAYRIVLGIEPNQPDALHLLGLVAHQRQDQLQAVELITRAIAFQPETAIFHNSLGAALERLLRLSEAVAHYPARDRDRARICAGLDQPRHRAPAPVAPR